MQSPTRLLATPGGLLALAVLVRIVVAVRTAVPARDSEHYLWVADEIAAGRLASAFETAHSPGYPALVAAALWLCPWLGSVTAGQLVSCTAGALAVLLTALACLLLGMEVPTTAAYVICISVAGPALEKLGLDALTTNLFVFWFALLSTITPPVCGAVFIAAGMVNENWLKVAAAAMALGVGLYVIPFAMIANPSLIALAHAPVSALAIFVKLAIGLSALSYGIISRRQLGGRLTLVALGLTMVFIRLPVVAVSQ